MQLKDSLLQILENLPRFLPEAWIGVAFLTLLLIELFLKHSSWRVYTSNIVWGGSILILCVGFGLVVLQLNVPKGYLFHGLLFLNPFAVLFKQLILLGGIWILLHIRVTNTSLPPDFYSIFLGLILGLLLLTMTVNGLSIYISLELVSISSYILATLDNDRKSSEGGMKYLLFGALSSAIMLYGMSLIYGITGSLDFTDNQRFGVAFMNNEVAVSAIAIFLTLGGILFKLSLVPFHIWTPDVYEGAPMPVAALLSTIPKLAAVLVLATIVVGLPVSFQPFLIIIAILSITIGNLAALWQNNLKRLLAYSGIAQAGFMIIGIIAQSRSGIDATMFYAITYIIINLGVFLAIDILSGGVYTLQSLAGKGFSRSRVSIYLTILMIALVGLPPTAGFTAKLLVFSSLWQNYQATHQISVLMLLIVGLVNTVVALFYYFKIPYYLFFKSAEADYVVSGGRMATVMILIATLSTLIFFLKADWLLSFIQKYWQ